MGITGSIVVFVVVWWLVFFMSLPFGVRGQWEDGSIEQGTEAGAPQVTGLGKKALITTGIAAAIWLGVWFTVRFDLLSYGEGLSWGLQ